jgi:epoxyqueuosine reductase
VIGSHQLVSRIQAWARELGFSQIGIAGVDLSSAEAGLAQWLAQGFHGEMHYMAAHGTRRARPAELVPGTVSVITARMDYLPRGTSEDWQAIEFDRLRRPGEAIVSLYARGRDYHKVMRTRLQKLADRIGEEVGAFGHRVFTDSAPVLEAELASRSGQGWRGKHTLVLDREAGSMFFLGEIYVDMALPASAPVSAHCGSCSACIEICPTRAIVAPHRLDARRCISYLTIEHAGPIPLELRPLIGNRIYGCDDCQLICPWNKFAKKSALPDFDAREGLTGRRLGELFAWNEAEFLRFTEGSPIRRIGHERWLRNIAVALGNALRAGQEEARDALATRRGHPSALVREHVEWALGQAIKVQRRRIAEICAVAASSERIELSRSEAYLSAGLLISLPAKWPLKRASVQPLMSSSSEALAGETKSVLEPLRVQAASGSWPRTLPSLAICRLPSKTAGGPSAPVSCCVT